MKDIEIKWEFVIGETRTITLNAEQCFAIWFIVGSRKAHRKSWQTVLDLLSSGI